MSGDNVRDPNSGQPVHPNKEDLGTSGPRCPPPACPASSAVDFHSPRAARLTPSDLSSLIRSRQEPEQYYRDESKEASRIDDHPRVCNLKLMS